MLTKILEWAGKNPFLVLLATLFIVISGVVAVAKTPLDALPDLSDVQVILYTEYPGQAPQVVEDQVTYPLTTAMLAVPKSKVVRYQSCQRETGPDQGRPVRVRGCGLLWWSTGRSRDVLCHISLYYFADADSRRQPGRPPCVGPVGAGCALAARGAGLENLPGRSGPPRPAGTVGAMDAPPAQVGPALAFSHRFAQPGLYKVWAQFAPNGQVITVAWVIEVH